jgi:ribulose-5-phosphate 4-epimerase/fuculose-1-phosphate aldolase
MNREFLEERQQVLDAVRRIVAAGLVSGSSGNVSRRISTPTGDLFAVTASRVPYHRFGIEDVLVVDAEIDPVVGDGVPSSESLAHMAVYGARPDVGAVIHTHSVYASAFAVAGQPIPCVLDEQVVAIGGAVSVAAYGASASQQLAANAVAALGERAAVLLRHHGVLGVGRDLEEAVAVVDLVERVAKVRLLSVQLGGGQELPADVVGAQQQVYRMMKGFKGK